MRVSNWNEKLWKNSWNHLALNNRNRCILLNRKQKSTYAILPLQNVDGVVKGGDNNDKYASMIFANETWNKLGEMGLHDLVFLWPNVNAHGTWKMKIKNVIFREKHRSIHLFQNSNCNYSKKRKTNSIFDKAFIISNNQYWICESCINFDRLKIIFVWEPK